jgi:hypothetical protein
MSFYTLPEYENWRETLASTAGWDIKYYKVGRGFFRPRGGRRGRLCAWVTGGQGQRRLA